MKEYLSLLWVGASFISVGLPDEPLPPLPVFMLMASASRVAGSHIGSKVEAIEMMKLAVEKGVVPM